VHFDDGTETDDSGIEAEDPGTAEEAGTSSSLADDESSQATREKDKLAIKVNAEILEKWLNSFIGSPFFQLI
jgi:hypothetical protein